MFGSKLRAWMEAVRPRKKQHRKDKQNKNLNDVLAANLQNTKKIQNDNTTVTVTGKGNTNKKIVRHAVEENHKTVQPPATSSRYSANNLSSPESAYSTGYSTDGTSPGAPPEHYINPKTGVRYFSKETPAKVHEQEICHVQQHYIPSEKPFPYKPASPSYTTKPCIPSVTVPQTRRPPNTPPQETNTRTLRFQSRTTTFQNNPPSTSAQNHLTVIASPVMTSPRQRNKIRTNPWLPGGSTLSPIQVRQEMLAKTKTAPNTVSPISRRFMSPLKRNTGVAKQSFSSSSCSSLSGSVPWEPRKPCSDSEDDCTLNEMMGKYDESYIYEKETDILSDSDPTDCDTDIDTGQDGGDEEDALEGEFDFIDNGSFLELDPREDRGNTGHCSYFNFESRNMSRRRQTRRSKQSTEKKRKSSSHKKRHKPPKPAEPPAYGSKSAGATPLSVRRTKQHHPVSKLAVEDCLKKRANSISFSRDPLDSIDRKDKEADRKYKELIGEAEQILRSMKIAGLSPRRVPGPTNKRVEILRSAECAKPELFLKSKLEEPSSQFVAKLPSSNFSPRFSPKRNHLTNFMIHNSPVLRKRELDMMPSPLVVYQPESPRHNRNSPKLKRKMQSKAKVRKCSSSSSDDDRTLNPIRSLMGFECPQSEPVRRKVYAERGKSVAFNLNCENVYKNSQMHKTQQECDYAEQRQQVLLTTIVNLKRNLEDQSASLKQVYRSSHNIHL